MTETKLNTSASTRRIMELLEKLDSGALVPRPDFQRRLVWDQKDKNEFLRTVLKSYPFPEIYLAVMAADLQTAKSTEALVDGQQRITTIHQYFKGSQALKLEKDIPSYQSLSKEQKTEFLNYQVAVRNLGIADIEIVRDVFKRINRTSHGLNKMERQNAEFQGALKRLGERIADSYFFEKYNVFSDREVRRMSDIVFSLSLLITMMSTYFHRESEVQPYLEKYNDELPEAEGLLRRFANVVALLRVVRLPKELRVWKKADLFVLIVELDRIVNIEKITINLKALRTLLVEFYSAVDKEMKSSSGDQSLQKYFKTTVQATADRSNRIGRAEVLRAVLLKAT
jgi:hypothetical protein